MPKGKGYKAKSGGHADNTPNPNIKGRSAAGAGGRGKMKNDGTGSKSAAGKKMKSGGYGAPTS